MMSDPSAPPVPTHPAGAFDGNYTISDDPGLLDVDVIHAFLSEVSYWAKGVSREIVERSIRHSLCFGVYHHGAQGEVAQVGFARAVTDHATYAYLADVVRPAGAPGARPLQAADGDDPRAPGAAGPAPLGAGDG